MCYLSLEPLIQKPLFLYRFTAIPLDKITAKVLSPLNQIEQNKIHHTVDILIPFDTFYTLTNLILSIYLIFIVTI